MSCKGYGLVGSEDWTASLLSSLFKDSKAFTLGQSLNINFQTTTGQSEIKTTLKSDDFKSEIHGQWSETEIKKPDLRGGNKKTVIPIETSESNKKPYSVYLSL
ncbi:hypothetical protein OVS_02505 [Mycoplasma ovis str. Michigan]|uniref:Uncharacterized protein n=1 Tax=Mycoplasma ovis str. Michigan TaxID=1415773 RepID=A0ABM5P1Y6_9MOLU|nr:hypothetical protein [Mycoplasma ovis]AHC40339.1 hypothetical protein OVS_02505 [Mycoplasma ovis str. Michigan]